MLLLKLNSKGDAVTLLQELLNEQGFTLIINGKFDLSTETAVKKFQLNNALVSDGVVYTKTWIKLLNNGSTKSLNDRSLKESEIIEVAKNLGIEPAVIKAVNAVESSGRGFLLDGNPKILFEGHVFWSQLQQRKIDPASLVKGNEDILYKSWTTKFYKGGKGEYDRLDKALKLGGNNKDIVEAAYASASWGLFQIMGYHYKSLGFNDIMEFIGAMQLNEGEHLKIFGEFIRVNGQLKSLKERNWAQFAKAYNGAQYAKNKYDIKLQQAYTKFA